MKFACSLAVAIAFATPALAQDHSGHASHAGHAAATPAGVVQATGVVRGVDPKAGTITIAHGPIKALNWGAMTMPFKVSDPALLKQAKVGAKIRFQLKGQQVVGLTVL